MGLSSKKQTSESKPVFANEVQGAASNITSAYNSTAPKIAEVADALGSATPQLLSRWTNGEEGVNAASAYNTEVLGGKYLGSNPYLDAIVQQSNDAARNGLSASLGTRGLTGGSAQMDIVGRALAQNTTNLYGQNYETERARMGQAAALAPGLSAARDIPLASIMSILQAQQAPIQAANTAGAGVGGLLSQYTKTTGKYSPSMMDNIGQAINIGKSVAGLF